jgi:hypothetical protein
MARSIQSDTVTANKPLLVVLVLLGLVVVKVSSPLTDLKAHHTAHILSSSTSALLVPQDTFPDPGTHASHIFVLSVRLSLASGYSTSTRSTSSMVQLFVSRPPKSVSQISMLLRRYTRLEQST